MRIAAELYETIANRTRYNSWAHIFKNITVTMLRIQQGRKNYFNRKEQF